MNGDLVTDLSIAKMLAYHKLHRSCATMAVAPYEVKIPYGVVETDGELLMTKIVEKPTHVSFINAGIYVLESETINMIPEKGSYDMPDLFQRLVERQKRTCVFPLREEWIDIGSIEAFEKVHQRFLTVNDGADDQAFEYTASVNDVVSKAL